MILSDRDILANIKKGRIKITPFIKKNIQPSTIDLTLSDKVRVFDTHNVEVIDVKRNIDPTRMVSMGKSGSFIVHPGEFILGSTIEKVSVPNDMAAKLEGRSSMGRLGLVVHATAGYVDPGFTGNLTLEISNISNLPIKLYKGMRVCQISFYQMTSEALVPYGSKKLKSKYQGQRDPTSSKVWKDNNK